MKTFTITSIADKGVVARELNEVTNPSMGARHVNYESMLKEYELTEDSKYKDNLYSIDRFCKVKPFVIPIRREIKVGQTIQGEVVSENGIEKIKII
jgi:hypothetical protein